MDMVDLNNRENAMIMQIKSKPPLPRPLWQTSLWSIQEDNHQVPSIQELQFAIELTTMCFYFLSLQDQFEFALQAVAEEVNAILKALPQWPRS